MQMFIRSPSIALPDDREGLLLSGADTSRCLAVAGKSGYTTGAGKTGTNPAFIGSTAGELSCAFLYKMGLVSELQAIPHR